MTQVRTETGCLGATAECILEKNYFTKKQREGILDTVHSYYLY